MRIAITGATGFVGSQLVPRVSAAGVETVLFSRDPEVLTAAYPEAEGRIFDYQDLEAGFQGADAVLHLAVLNNNNDTSLEAFRTANVHFLQKVVEASYAAGVQKFIYTSSLHATETDTPYGKTKAEAEALLRAGEATPEVTVLRLPAVYGDKFAGRLGKIMGALPEFFRKPIFMLVSALKPTVHVDRLADAVLEIASTEDFQAERLVTDEQRGNFVYHGTKRLLDLTFAITIIALFWWFLVIIWVAVRITSPGPGIFSQKRLGRGGKEFTCYKFRTMKAGTKSAGTHTISAASITPVGKFLRATKLDELPQVANILFNEMSLIGPRPGLPNQEELAQERQKRGVFEVKGGITGYAQINEIDMSTPEKLSKADAYYLGVRTLPLDLKILLKTFLGAGQGDRVSK